MENFDSFKKKILQRATACELVPLENKGVSDSLLNLLDRIDGLAQSANDTLSQLKEINRDLAQKIIAQVLHKDMAYGTIMQDEKTSSELALDFVSLFGENAKFFTNVDPEDFIESHQKHSAYASGLITNATFNIGVFGIDNAQGGFILVEDED